MVKIPHGQAIKRSHFLYHYQFTNVRLDKIIALSLIFLNNLSKNIERKNGIFIRFAVQSYIFELHAKKKRLHP